MIAKDLGLDLTKIDTLLMSVKVQANWLGFFGLEESISKMEESTSQREGKVTHDFNFK